MNRQHTRSSQTAKAPLFKPTSQRPCVYKDARVLHGPMDAVCRMPYISGLHSQRPRANFSLGREGRKAGLTAFRIHNAHGPTLLLER